MEKVTAFILKMLTLIWVYLDSVHNVLIGVTVIVCLDFITGIMAARARKEKINSHGLRRTITKTFVYQSSIVVAMILEKYLLQGVPVIKVVSTLIALTEAQSFFENVEDCTGINFYEKILNKLHGGVFKKDKNVDKQ